MTAKNTNFHADHQPLGQSTDQMFDVDSIVRDPASNGRFEGHDESEVRELALDILGKSQPGTGNRPMFHGQMHAVICERDSEGRPVLVAGYGRVNAIDWINANVNVPDVKCELERLNLLSDKGELERPFPVKVKIAPKMSAQDGILFNMSENARRKPLSPMDWATVIQKLVALGLTDAQIVEILKPYRPTGKVNEIHTTWVGQMRTLLMLSPDMQVRVHRGEIPVHQAIVIYRNAKDITDADSGEKLTGAKLHEEMDRQVAQTISPETGEVDKAKLRANNRVQNAARGKPSTLTIAEFKGMIETSIKATGSTVAIKIMKALKSEISAESFLSFLADFGPEDFTPEGSEKPASKGRKAAKATSKPTAAAKPAKSGKAPKAGANTPAPAAGGEAVKPGENAPAVGATAAVDGNGIRLPPKRSTGGRTKRNVAPVAEQVELTTAQPEVASEPSAEVETAPEQVDSLFVQTRLEHWRLAEATVDTASPDTDSEPSAEETVETAPLADAADDVDPEPSF